MRIACVGGGPGGLLAALLAKRSDPAREVTLFERNRAEDTFGFGVHRPGHHQAPIRRSTIAPEINPSVTV